MAIERVVRCDFCGEFVSKEDRRRLAVRRDEDRPESAEYVDVCVPHQKLTLAELINYADGRRPEMADGTTH